MMPPLKPARVLIVAGSDSGGGAGIQGDIKTVTCLGGYASTAITALTAQNTTGVYGIIEVPDDFIIQQIRLVLDDIGADAIKAGMLHKASTIQAVADMLADYPYIPLILDPVMVAKGGTPLLQPDAVNVLMRHLIPRAAMITPNIPEAELLLASSGMAESHIMTPHDMQEAGEKLLIPGLQAVLMKGGHLPGEEVTDMLLYKKDKSVTETRIFTSPRIHSHHTHGTGCALASAVATSIAQGLTFENSVIRAREYVLEAIRSAPGLGKGHGPLNHGHTMKIP